MTNLAAAEASALGLQAFAFSISEFGQTGASRGCKAVAIATRCRGRGARGGGRGVAGCVDVSDVHRVVGLRAR